MSTVTNVILKTHVTDCANVRKLNTAFICSGEAGANCNSFVSCDAVNQFWYAGNKALECEVYPGAFNYLNEEKLLDAIRAIEWEAPDCVQLFIQRQDENLLRELPIWNRRRLTYADEVL